MASAFCRSASMRFTIAAGVRAGAHNAYQMSVLALEGRARERGNVGRERVALLAAGGERHELARLHVRDGHGPEGT
jgi:hypothetical protein